MLCTCCGEEADLQTTTCAGCGARFRRNTLGIVAGIALLAAALREGQPLWLSLMLALIAVALLSQAVPRRWYPYTRSGPLPDPSLVAVRVSPSRRHPPR
uniref:hypothetical protein n=1 Tax=Pantanalinema rosaneae TaxID=1620701 RepID=UPI003D6DE308